MISINRIGIYVTVLILIIFFGFRVYKKKKDNKIIDEINRHAEEEHSEEEVSENEKVKEHMMPLNLLNKLTLPKKIEILECKPCHPRIFFRYGNNLNHIYNDGRAVWQSTIRFLDNRAIINGFRYGLSRIEFHKSILTWKGKEVALEMHVVNTNVESGKKMVFVFPLSLVDLRRVGFVDLGFSNQPTDVATLNSLITKTEQVPPYYCCTPNQGHMVNFNLCPVANVILQQKIFYRKVMSSTETWIITVPQPFDRYIGLNIRSKLVG